MTDPEKLSRRERQIMRAVYAKGSITVKELGKAISHPPSATALRTTVGILVGKGWLKAKLAGSAKVYSAARSKASVSRNELRGLLTAFFGGSIEQLLVSHFSDPDNRLDDESYERLLGLIEQNVDETPQSTNDTEED
ncbi:MAG: BlaI/MecI/CopY family transcriptional regulator [Fuerstiella sp.]